MNEIKAEIKPLKKILCDDEFCYNIPEYQRPYAWNEDNLSALVDDLENAYNNNNEEDYFCGSLVLIKGEHDRYDVIDGQQRITTFIIMCCVLRDYYENELDDQAKAYITESIYARFDNEEKIKIFTDEYSQGTFQNTVIKKISEKVDKKNKYLKNAHFLREYIDEKKESIEDISKFIKWVFEKVVMTTIICSNQNTAIQIFNILNDRGMPLSSIDILKSLLMKNLSGEDKNVFKNSWNKISERIKNNDLTMEDLFSRYLYYKIVSNPKGSLHKELLNAFSNEESLVIIGNLEKFAKCYIDIVTMEDKYIYCLHYLHHSIYWQSILTSAEYEEYKDREILKKMLVSYYYKNWIAGATISRIKQTSFNILRYVKEGKSIDEIERIINENLGRHGTQDNFKSALNNEWVFWGKWSKPLLLLIEYFSKDDSNQSFIPLDKNTTIEHILPQNSDNESWGHFTQEDKDNWVNSLANLTLLSKRKNSQASNKSFKDKKEAYKNRDGKATSFEITRRIFENDEWTVKELEARHEELIQKINEVFHH